MVASNNAAYWPRIQAGVQFLPRWLFKEAIDFTCDPYPEQMLKF